MATRRGPILVVAVRHRPFEISILITVLASAIINLVNGPSMTMQSISELIPLYEYIWPIGVGLGSIIGLTAIFVKQPTALLWERLGLFILATFFTGYSIAAIITLGLVGFSGALFLLMFAIAAVFRIRQLTADIELIKGMSSEVEKSGR